MEKISWSHILVLPFILLVFACTQEKGQEDTPKRFTLLSPEYTGILFENTLTEGLNTNILMYEYFYNGGGVAVGDLNGDGLDDIYFSGNMTENRLYLNKGGMKFEDITTASGVAGRAGPWKTGVTMADVNGDGHLDIYVCYSGSLPPEKRSNELYLNLGNSDKGIPKFKEAAREWGIDSEATSTQASFFDYDLDGDLDLFLLNHNPKSLPVLDESNTAEILKTTDQAGPQLLRNEGSQFTEVTDQAGILKVALSYGLGAGIADINGDGWPDIYICNDYTVPDYLYINNGDGTFKDAIGEMMGHTSHFSMGNDIADINNDGLPDIFTLDMLPEGNKRQKLLMAPDNYEKFEFGLNMGFHHQYMRNMLHLNHGNGTFSEVGQLAGVSNTDWSWAALFADLDNDGLKDLYITNGYFRDYTNQDFLKYMADYLKNNQNGLRRENILELVYQMPSSNLVNYTFKNEDGLHFRKVISDWGLDQPANSNGAAYADLDNDGDLDLIVNNINKAAFIYQNNSDSMDQNHFLNIKLKGSDSNPYGIGAKITAYQENNIQYIEQMPTRGYQSSISPVLHLGLGEVEVLDSLTIKWPRGKQETLRQLDTNQTIELKETDALPSGHREKEYPVLFKEIDSPISTRFQKDNINDFKRQPLMVNPLSFSGPVMIQGDINGDGLADVYLGGEAGESGQIWLKSSSGSYREKLVASLDEDKGHQDSDAVMVDINNDGYLDLYVASGGYGRFLPEDPLLQDRMYLNDGSGNFTRAKEALPTMLTSTGTVAFHDVNEDGFVDLFVGSRVIPGRYPEIPESYLLVNDGKGNFADRTDHLATELKQIGLVSDGEWVDLDQDGQKELLLVGEWMGIKVFNMENGEMKDQSTRYFEQAYQGWWNTIHVRDLTGDGLPDLVIGNHGLNSQVKASKEEPAEMHYKDFDDNGAVDPILSFYIEGESYPYLTRDELLDQMSMMRTRFGDYASYSDAKLDDIFSEEALDGAGYWYADLLETSLFINQGGGKMKHEKLPAAAQFAPVYAINSLDADKDGHLDLLLFGNIERARLRFGKYDANLGVLLTGDGNGKFSYVPQRLSGLKVSGDVRSTLITDQMLLLGINQDRVRAYEIKE